SVASVVSSVVVSAVSSASASTSLLSVSPCRSRPGPQPTTQTLNASTHRTCLRNRKLILSSSRLVGWTTGHCSAYARHARQTKPRDDRHLHDSPGQLIGARTVHRTIHALFTAGRWSSSDGATRCSARPRDAAAQSADR